MSWIRESASRNPFDFLQDRFEVYADGSEGDDDDSDAETPEAIERGPRRLEALDPADAEELDQMEKVELFKAKVRDIGLQEPSDEEATHFLTHAEVDAAVKAYQTVEKVERMVNHGWVKPKEPLCHCPLAAFPAADIHVSTQDWYKCASGPAEAVISPRSELGPMLDTYSAFRESLDYTWHRNWCVERQGMQDQVIARFAASAPLVTAPWTVFLAGPMAGGKSHWLAHHLSPRIPAVTKLTSYRRPWARNDVGLLSKEPEIRGKFAGIDYDVLREALPDWKGVNGAGLDDEDLAKMLQGEAAPRTQMEAAILGEVLQKMYLYNSANVLIDGSLHNATWWSKEMRMMKRMPSQVLQLRRLNEQLEAGRISIAEFRERVGCLSGIALDFDTDENDPCEKSAGPVHLSTVSEDRAYKGRGRVPGYLSTLSEDSAEGLGRAQGPVARVRASKPRKARFPGDVTVLEPSLPRGFDERYPSVSAFGRGSRLVDSRDKKHEMQPRRLALFYVRTESYEQIKDQAVKRAAKEGREVDGGYLWNSWNTVHESVMKLQELCDLFLTVKNPGEDGPPPYVEALSVRAEDSVCKKGLQKDAPSGGEGLDPMSWVVHEEQPAGACKALGADSEDWARDVATILDVDLVDLDLPSS